MSVGDDIRVYVLETRGRQVRLGIEAPRSVPVYRDEFFCQLQGNETPSWEPLAIGLQEGETAPSEPPPSQPPPMELPPYEPPEDELHG